MDSAGYSEKNLRAWQEIGWVTRVPETVGEAKAVLQAVEAEAMEEVSDGYRICPLCNTYGDVRQRWLLVYSRQAYERESKQLEKRVARAKEKAENIAELDELTGLGNRRPFPRRGGFRRVFDQIAGTHPPIVEALESGDVETAVRLVAEHADALADFDPASIAEAVPEATRIFIEPVDR